MMYGRRTCKECGKQFSTYDLRKGKRHELFAHNSLTFKSIWDYFSWWVGRFFFVNLISFLWP